MICLSEEPTVMFESIYQGVHLIKSNGVSGVAEEMVRKQPATTVCLVKPGSKRLGDRPMFGKPLGNFPQGLAEARVIVVVKFLRRPTPGGLLVQV